MCTIKKLLIILICLMFVVPNLSFANELEVIGNTVDDQNDRLYESIMKNKKDKINPLDQILDESDRKNAAPPSEINLSNIAKSLEINSIRLALWARKYIFPFTILIILFNIAMYATTGVKNYSNRRKYIFGSIFFYILFLIILNFPLFLLWTYSLEDGSMFSFDKFYIFVEGVTTFFKKNSFVFSIIVLSYGAINYISAQSDLPKQFASKFAIKASFFMFILFQILPFVMKLAI